MDDVDALLADLARWTADAGAGEAARSRIRERWLRHQAEEEARFAGLALDLAEAGVPVALRLTSGRMLHGRVEAVARDFCVVRTDAGTPTLVAFDAVATVRPDPAYRADGAPSSRTGPVDVGLVEVLAGLAGERPRVRIVAEGSGEAVAGELRSVGADVATVRLDGARAGSVYVRLGAVREVALLG